MLLNLITMGKYLLCFVLFLLASSAQAQNIYINFSDGSSSSYPLSSVEKITYAGNDMIVHFDNNTTLSWNVLEIENYTYKELTSIRATSNAFKSFEISPNPIIDHANVVFTARTKGEVSIEVFSVDGSLVSSSITFAEANEPTEVQLNDLEQIQHGIYFCRINMGNSSLTEKLIKK